MKLPGHGLSSRVTTSGTPVAWSHDHVTPRVPDVTPRSSVRQCDEGSAISADPSGPGQSKSLGMTGAAVVLVSLLAACSSNPKPVTYAFPPPEAPAVGTVVEGIASWYGPEYHGRRTSSGEAFNQDALTAAHAYWAFGTRVRVTLLSTGKSVVVRINDRFPSHKGRAIDLSRGAAKAIGLIGPGTGQVRLEVVE
jgi:rare lipoprotein A (peptidoglycan hydrolase)